MGRLLHSLLTCAAALSWPGAPAHAAPDFPARNVTLIVPYPAGGGTDLFARAIAQQLTSKYGLQVIVDNRSGASGN